MTEQEAKLVRADMLKRGERSQRKLQEFSSLISDLIEGFKYCEFEDADDEELIRLIACIVENTGGTMPYAVCSLCGNQDDWHYNNNAECS